MFMQQLYESRRDVLYVPSVCSVQTQKRSLHSWPGVGVALELAGMFVECRSRAVSASTEISLQYTVVAAMENHHMLLLMTGFFLSPTSSRSRWHSVQCQHFVYMKHRLGKQKQKDCRQSKQSRRQKHRLTAASEAQCSFPKSSSVTTGWVHIYDI